MATTTETTTDTIVVTCGACGQRNRVSTKHDPDDAICGRCKQPLGLGHVAVVTDQSFNLHVEASAMPVVLDCWAPWCGPCRMVAPVIEDLAKDLVWKVKFAKLNVDENPQTSARFRTSSIPTLLLFRDGQNVGRIVGAQPKPAILAELQRVGFV